MKVIGKHGPNRQADTRSSVCGVPFILLTKASFIGFLNTSRVIRHMKIDFFSNLYPCVFEYVDFYIVLDALLLTKYDDVA